MVFVFDLDESDSSSSRHQDVLAQYAKRYQSHRHNLPTPAESCSGQEEENRPNPNLNIFSAALACYPIVSALAANLDLNSIHNLSRTCRQFRGTLLLYRDQLVSRTLQCSNDSLDQEDMEAQRISYDEPFRPTVTEGRGYPRVHSYRLTSGKVSRCARDLVAECRRCGLVVCRNCTARQPPSWGLKIRCRRLCRTCLKAPLDTHLTPVTEQTPQFWRSPTRTNRAARSFDLPSSPSRSAIHTTDTHKSPASVRSNHSNHNLKTESSIPSSSSSPPDLSFTYFAFKRTPCTCDTYNHLCPPCGRDLIAQDRVYESGWTWRNKYSAYVGVAEGNKGVECGRRSACLAARLVEQESDCNASDLDHGEVVSSGRSWEGGGFVAQEVEGVGGIVKMKVKKLVMVGAEVDGLDEDALEEDPYAKRSSVDRSSALASSISTLAAATSKWQKDDERSWCSWCERIVPGANDVWDRAWDIGGDSK